MADAEDETNPLLDSLEGNVCLDSSAWIEIAHNGPNARTFLNAGEDMARVIISSITLYEVWKYTAVNAGEARAQQLSDLLQQGVLVPLDSQIALSASRISILHKIAMADSIIYATALAHHATLWTQDDDFEGLPQVMYFPKIKP